MTEPEKTKSRHNKSSAGKNLTKLVAKSYMDLHTRANEGAFVVWVAIIVPVEILHGFENIVYAVPESHSALCAAKGVGPLLAERSEQNGYSMDLCSYARIDIGSAFSGAKDDPTWGLPKPDFIITDNNNCSLLAKWFDVYHREWDVPHFIIDVPFAYEAQKEKDLDYIVSQFKDLIKTIERLSGQKFDIEKTRRAVEISNKTVGEWRRYLKCAETRPAGITVFDTFVHMAPLLTLRGRPEALEHMKTVADETEKRIEEGVFPMPDEKYRLLWDNIAPWHQLKNMSSRLRERDANIIAASYTYSSGTIEGGYDHHKFDGKDPLRHVARAQNHTICPMGLANRISSMRTAIERNSIDGMVFASNRSCKVYSLMQIDQMKRLSKETGVPAVMIDVDHADSRKYSESSTYLRMEALLEKIDAKRLSKSA